MHNVCRNIIDQEDYLCLLSIDEMKQMICGTPSVTFEMLKDLIKMVREERTLII